MWFRDFFYNCLNAFLSLFSTLGGGAYDYNGIWWYVPLGIVVMIPFLIGCIQIVGFVIATFVNFPKRHKSKKIKRKMPWENKK